MLTNEGLKGNQDPSCAGVLTRGPEGRCSLFSSEGGSCVESSGAGERVEKETDDGATEWRRKLMVVGIWPA